ncbi:MAG: response regulator, partial [Planctomycetota bacterium]
TLFVIIKDKKDGQEMKKAKILVTDDIKQNVKLLRVILTAADYDVIEAYDGEEAVEKARTERPDIIILDVMMPRLTGYEVCQKLRADDTTRNIPVIMVTALHEMDDRIKGIEAGADDFISKPFNKVELLARVKSLLRARLPAGKKDEIPVLDAILSDLMEGVVITDGQWKIKRINKAAREFFYPYEPLMEDMDFSVFLSQRNLSIPTDVIIHTQEKTTDFLILPSNNQNTPTLNARVTKAFDENGALTGIACIIKNK